MRIATFASIAALSMMMAASPLTTAGFDIAALAKNGGNGGGNGNGGGHGNGNGGAQSSSHENRGNATGKTSRDGSTSDRAAKGKSGETHGKSLSVKSTPADMKQKNVRSELAGLNSLNRSYKAYMHTSDPRMTAIAAYATAYAQYELDNGFEPAFDDPILGDAALRDALESASKTGHLSRAAFAEAKTILGIRGADGKIDEIREALSDSAPTLTGN